MKKIIIAIFLFLSLSYNSNARDIVKIYNIESNYLSIMNCTNAKYKISDSKYYKNIKKKKFIEICGFSTGAYSSSFQMDCPDGSTYTVYDVASYIEVTFCENGVPFDTGIIITDLDIVEVGGC